ncbi:MAG: peptidoglycan bridge formation glycyltransferase FemA/FemB family protein, partial [Candidatus Liptonbacteria bacterium]|nr:peptidoglycan bridge formation glycyltransferase FemA/FemB family protein [Candidatus Liptonbacteria bacterium]
MEVAKDIWNRFIAENSSPSSFIQSWQWGEFQAALGNKVERIILPSLQAQVIVRGLPLGKVYLEIPKGPVMENPNDKIQISKFTEEIKKVAGKEKAVFVRVNSPYDIEPPGQFRKPKILLRQMEPERTILVDLTKSEDELVANMHEKSRYNIRLAERKGVRVRKATADEGAFRKFLELLRETTRRDGIVSWPDERFWKFRAIFMSGNPSPDIPRAELLVGEHGGRLLAAAIIMLFGDSATYLYAASSGEERNANVPSLVLWEAIREAKRQGSRWYDMWGVSPADDPNHSWAGITRFKSRYVKLGVTGKEIRSVGTRDLILNKP